MNKIVIVLLLVFFILLFVTFYLAKNREKTIDVRMFQFNKTFSNYTSSDPISKPFNEFGFSEVTRFNDANFVFFTDYVFIDHYLPNVKFEKDTTIYGFAGTDQLANKAYFAKHMKGQKCIPKTYILEEEYPTVEGKYFLKKNIQRQEGNLIIDDLSFIKTAIRQDYVVAQELIQDVYIVNKRKINMRVYVLLVIYKNNIQWYVYKDGFMYYTPKFYQPNSIERDTNITTGYIDRSVYEENPLTHKDFYEYLGYQDAQKLRINIVKAIKTVKDVYSDELLMLNKNIQGMKVNVLGFDVAPTHDLDVLLIEVNKGCSLEYMDDRDKEVKYNMIKNMFNLIGALPEGDKSMFEEI